MIRLRAATPDDAAEVLPRTRALNAHEEIEVDEATLAEGLRRLLARPELGGVWLVEDEALIGYAVVTFGYDLEFGGRDAYLTEMWIDEEARGRGAARAALELLFEQLRERDVRALHLQVRPDNPAVRLYERSGFSHVPRIVMTRRLL